MADHSGRPDLSEHAPVPPHPRASSRSTTFAQEPIIDDPATGTDPDHEALLADSVGIALQVVLDTLSPAERLAFVLHDIFAVPFDEIALDGRALTADDPSARQPCPPARARGGAASRTPTWTRPAGDRGRLFRRRPAREGDFEALVRRCSTRTCVL